MDYKTIGIIISALSTVCVSLIGYLKVKAEQKDKQQSYRKIMDKQEMLGKKAFTIIPEIVNRLDSVGLSCVLRNELFSELIKNWLQVSDSTIREYSNRNFDNLTVGDFRHDWFGLLMSIDAQVKNKLKEKLPRELIFKLDNIIFNPMLKSFEAIISAVCSDEAILENNYERHFMIVSAWIKNLEKYIEILPVYLEKLNGDVTNLTINKISKNDCKNSECLCNRIDKKMIAAKGELQQLLVACPHGKKDCPYESVRQELNKDTVQIKKYVSSLQAGDILSILSHHRNCESLSATQTVKLKKELNKRLERVDWRG